jgi:5'-3' exonuclease
VTVLVLDTATLYYRAFFALPESLTAPDGHPNNAIRGTLSMLTGLIDRHRTSEVVACWDADWRPKWRVALVPEYKAHRVADADADAEDSEPDTLGPQIGALAQIFDSFGVARPGRARFEADDVIASIAAHGTDERIVVTNDRDLVQVIHDQRRVRVQMMVTGGMDAWPVLDEAAAAERYGVVPDKYVDMAVLRGDPSDGLPGVPGVGTKTAVRLIDAFGDLDGVLRAAENPEPPLTPRIAGAILHHAEALRAARTVATAVTALRVSVRPWSPQRIRPRLLRSLATEWGVEGPVDRLRSALQTHHDPTA